MPQPASELLEEIRGLKGEKRIISGVDKRGRLDVFIYSKGQDRVYQIKLESIRPGLRGPHHGYHLVGVGDEVCAGDDVIEKIMNNGWEMNSYERFLEKISKLSQEHKPIMITAAALIPEGSYDVFSSLPPDSPLYEDMLARLPVRIDGRLSSELNRQLDRQRLGTSTYIA